MRANVLRWLRLSHLYIGIFTAPAILFFAFTGALQTLTLNDRAPDGSYTPPRWISVLAQIHKKQTAQLPRRSPDAPGPSKPARTLGTGAPSLPAAAVQAPPKPVALKAFFVLVCGSLFASTFSGACMAWKHRRNRLVYIAVFTAGILVPFALMNLHTH